MRKSRPNKNLVLDAMRDGDTYDMWGLAMAWAFAVAENLYAEGEEVPSELGFRPSLLGPVLESYEDLAVKDMLDSGDVSVEEVQFAGRCLARLLDWLRADGQDY